MQSTLLLLRFRKLTVRFPNRTVKYASQYGLLGNYAMHFIYRVLRDPGGWKELHIDERHNLYSLDIRINESRRMRWAGQVA
jgi:hypothetical protein